MCVTITAVQFGALQINEIMDVIFHFAKPAVAPFSPETTFQFNSRVTRNHHATLQRPRSHLKIHDMFSDFSYV